MDEPYVHRIYSDIGLEIKDTIALTKWGFAKKEFDIDKAILAYPIKHYTFWEEEDKSIVVGGFGEHFSVLEMDEYSVCIGDCYQMNDAIIQVSQPGLINRRQFRDSLRTGWYFRVLQEGNIKDETDLKLIDRPYPYLSIALINEAYFTNALDLRTLDEIYTCEALSPIWRKAIRKKLRGF